MADTQAEDLMNYDKLANNALKGVLRSVLERLARENEAPGAHHFYITFKTWAPDVVLHKDIAAKYPDDMTIILQHQFWNLRTNDVGFTVDLKFSGVPRTLIVPWTAVTRFYDPSVQFLLQFEEPERPVVIETATMETTESNVITPAFGKPRN